MLKFVGNVILICPLPFSIQRRFPTRNFRQINHVFLQIAQLNFGYTLTDRDFDSWQSRIDWRVKYAHFLFIVYSLQRSHSSAGVIFFYYSNNLTEKSQNHSPHASKKSQLATPNPIFKQKIKVLAQHIRWISRFLIDGSKDFPNNKCKIPTQQTSQISISNKRFKCQRTQVCGYRQSAEFWR